MHNLTLSRTRSDPIDYLINGFLFHDFEYEFRHSRSDLSLFSQQNLTFKHSFNAEINLEEEESKRFKD